jgi:hypothetical protein
MRPGSMCATPNCDLCAEEQESEALDAALIGVPCGDTFDPGDGAVKCVLIRGHSGRHTDGGDEWSYP